MVSGLLRLSEFQYRRNTTVLNRRKWLQGLAATAGAIAVPAGLRGALQCGAFMPPWGIQACVAGIPEERMNMVFAFQQESEWCWAACLQMVFAYWGHRISQQEIVKQTWGVIANMPAQPYDIVRDLNRDWEDSSGDFTVPRGRILGQRRDRGARPCRRYAAHHRINGTRDGADCGFLQPGAERARRSDRRAGAGSLARKEAPEQ